MMRIRRLIAAEQRLQHRRLAVAGGAAAVLSVASVLLLGLSGWFITGAALAGLGGASAALVFNVLLPSAGIRLLAILRTGCRYAERLSGHDAAFRALARIRPRLYRALAASAPGRALALSTGEAVARIVQDVDEIEALFVRRSSAWGAIASGLGGAVLLLLAGPAAACAAGCVLVALVVACHRLAARLAPLGRAVPRANGLLKDSFASLAIAAPELCAYGLEEWAAGRIDAEAQGLLTAQSKVTAASGWFDLLLATATGLAAMLALALSRGSVPMAALAALGVVMMIDGAAPYLRGLQRQGNLAAAEERLETMLQPPPSRPAARRCRPVPAITLSGTALTPGAIIGVTGPSGCGKTTLIEQIMGLRDAEPGRVLVDGVDINDLGPVQRRACFAYAPQNAALLSGTVRDNLCLGDPKATADALWAALRDAALDDRVRTLPQGLESWIGEDGARLSGGERRRLSLARTLLRPAAWLLLDEPTEGLDAATEARVMDRLAARLALSGQGALIVSHRPVPLEFCDAVLRKTYGEAGSGVTSTGSTSEQLQWCPPFVISSPSR